MTEWAYMDMTLGHVYRIMDSDDAGLFNDDNVNEPPRRDRTLIVTFLQGKPCQDCERRFSVAGLKEKAGYVPPTEDERLDVIFGEN